MRLMTIVKTSLAALVAGAVYATPLAVAADETEYSCTTKACTDLASCNGAYWEALKDCGIQCFNLGPGPGQVTKSGSADCGQPILD